MLRSEFEKLTGFYPPENLFAVIKEYYMQSELNMQDFCYGYRFNVNGIAEKIQNEVNARTAHNVWRFGMLLGETEREVLSLKEKIKKIRSVMQDDRNSDFCADFYGYYISGIRTLDIPDVQKV
ncbi:MAG: hypothetical protein K2J88_06875 [Oscillospiraceae bacterium]|nr:hypothetical protein [Oscillospiraceae bacterium]